MCHSVAAMVSNKKQSQSNPNLESEDIVVTYTSNSVEWEQNFLILKV